MTVFALSGCTEILRINLGGGLPDQVYEPVPLYSGQVNSVGTLTEAYIQNTEGLMTANNRLSTICVAYRVCVKSENQEQ